MVKSHLFSEESMGCWLWGEKALTVFRRAWCLSRVKIPACSGVSVGSLRCGIGSVAFHFAGLMAGCSQVWRILSPTSLWRYPSTADVLIVPHTPPDVQACAVISLGFLSVLHLCRHIEPRLFGFVRTPPGRSDRSKRNSIALR